MIRPGVAAVVVASILLAASGCARGGVGVESYPMPGRPSAVVVAAGLVWVADDQNGAVWIVDPATGEVQGDEIGVAANPIALAASARTVWVGHAGGEVTPIGVSSRRAGRPIQAGGSITGLATVGEGLWGADSVAAELAEIIGGSVVRRISVPEGVVRVASHDGEIWVSNAERTVTRVDPRTGEVGPVVEVGLGPIGLTGLDGSVWVANSDEGTVSRIEARAGRDVTEVEARGAPVAIAAGQDSVWVVSQVSETLARIDGSSGMPVGVDVELSTNPRGVAAGAGAVWVAGTNPSRLIRVLPD